MASRTPISGPRASERADMRAAMFAQALAFVPYGFAPFEIVYKRRKGGDTDPASKYDDGRVGWRKFAFRAQDTLTPGDEWVFDEHGGVAALNQSPPPDYRRVTVPVEKLILYRSTAAKNNPQGRSVLRAAYVPWYYSKNMQEIEGISAERMGSGFPVVYLGEGTKKVGANSDFESAKVVVRDVRSDEQSGIVFPYQKQGADGKGILFELVSPPSRGAVDFNQIINRYNQQIGQVVLSQFIFLGLTASSWAFPVYFKEQYYKLYHIHYVQYPDDAIENIYNLEQAYKADFCNPLYALAKIEDKKDWAN